MGCSGGEKGLCENANGDRLEFPVFMFTCNMHVLSWPAEHIGEIRCPLACLSESCKIECSGNIKIQIDAHV